MIPETLFHSDTLRTKSFGEGGTSLNMKQTSYNRPVFYLGIFSSELRTLEENDDTY